MSEGAEAAKGGRVALWGLPPVLILGAAVAVGGGLVGGGALEARSERLFYLSRSTNANLVVYDAALLGDRFDPEEPIRVYWILAERGGQRQKLSGLERRRAFGVDIAELSPQRVRFSLVALRSRPITALLEDGAPKAYIELEGKRARLESVYVSVRDGLIPSVRYVEVWGRDPDTGAQVIERFQP